MTLLPHSDTPCPTRRTLLAGLATTLALPALSRMAFAASDPLSLSAQPGSVRLLGPEMPPTDLFTYDGRLPGPTLRVKAGRDLLLSFANRLQEPTSLCWGGFPVPNAALGVPGVAGAAVDPAQTAEIQFPAATAGTFLFGPFDSNQAARGLAGVLVVEEDGPPVADRDLVLLIQDWRLAPDERVHLTVNGEPAPRLPVRAGERVRLRFLNATRGLFLPMRLDGHQSWIIAIDGRPAEPFAPSDGRLLLAPGGRVDLLVDFAQPPGTSLPLIVETPDGDMPLASLAYAPDLPLRAKALAAPAPLPGGDQPVPLSNAARFTVEFGDAVATAFGRQPLLRVTRNRTVVAAITNRSASAASIRLYGHSARLLDSMDDGWKPWWHDAIGVAPGRTVRLAFVAGPIGRWPIVVRRGGDDVPLALGWFETGAT